LYNILIEFGVPMKLVRLTKMCWNETYSKVRIGKYLSANFSVQSSRQKSPQLSYLLYNIPLGASRKTRWG
jgi:hypothetical protein